MTDGGGGGDPGGSPSALRRLRRLPLVVLPPLRGSSGLLLLGGGAGSGCMEHAAKARAGPGACEAAAPHALPHLCLRLTSRTQSAQTQPAARDEGEVEQEVATSARRASATLAKAEAVSCSSLRASQRPQTQGSGPWRAQRLDTAPIVFAYAPPTRRPSRAKVGVLYARHVRRFLRRHRPLSPTLRRLCSLFLEAPQAQRPPQVCAAAARMALPVLGLRSPLCAC